MASLKKTLAVAALASATVAAIPAFASAAVVCNAANECWHTHRSYHYDPAFGVVVHPNNWKWGPNDHYTWHEHAGRGYWRNGVWVTF